MVYPNEIVMFILGLTTLTYILINRSKWKQIPHYKLLLTCFYILVFAWGVTILEGFFWKTILNYVEHTGYAVSSFLLMLWLIFLTQEHHSRDQ